MLWPFVVVTVIALAVVLYTERREASIAAAAAAAGNKKPALAKGTLLAGALGKVVASAAFLAAAVAAHALDTFYGQTLFIALAWSFVGDVLLIFRGAQVAFMIGIGAFLLSHVGYVMVFRMRGVDGDAVLYALAAFGLVGVAIGRVLWSRVRGGMRVAVVLYIAVITLMVAFAVGTVAYDRVALPLVAALLFWLSDLFVARQRFVRRSLWNRAIGLPLYYAAQYLFIALLPT